jgi:hypothetical protein
MFRVDAVDPIATVVFNCDLVVSADELKAAMRE